MKRPTASCARARSPAAGRGQVPPAARARPEDPEGARRRGRDPDRARRARERRHLLRPLRPGAQEALGHRPRREPRGPPREARAACRRAPARGRGRPRRRLRRRAVGHPLSRRARPEAPGGAAGPAPDERADRDRRARRDVIAARNAILTGDAHGNLAEIRRRQGDLAGAEREARLGCEAVRPFRGVAWALVALHARTLLEQGCVEEALAVAEGGVQEMERLGLEGNGEIDLRLCLAEALHTAGRAEAARAALSDMLPRLKKRSDDIPDPALRARYLTNVAVNARVVALAGAWLGRPLVS